MLLQFSLKLVTPSHIESYFSHVVVPTRVAESCLSHVVAVPAQGANMEINGGRTLFIQGNVTPGIRQTIMEINEDLEQKGVQSPPPPPPLSKYPFIPDTQNHCTQLA